MRYEVEVHIDAEPEKVWEVLVDVEHWPEWTPSMTSVQRLEEGSFGVGNTARVQQPRIPRAVYTVTEYQAGRSFTWAAGSIGVRTRASHDVAAQAGGGTTVRLAVSQTGVFAPVSALFAASLIRRYLAMEAQGLKGRCETGA